MWLATPTDNLNVKPKQSTMPVVQSEMAIAVINCPKKHNVRQNVSLKCRQSVCVFSALLKNMCVIHAIGNVANILHLKYKMFLTDKIMQFKN